VDGIVLDIVVQPRRDANAAKCFFRRLLMGLPYVPRVIVTYKLQSYCVARRQLLRRVEHRQCRYLGNRAENSHRTTRRRKRQMQRFKSPEQAQDFRARIRQWPLPSSPAPSDHQCLSQTSGRNFQRLAARDRRSADCVIDTTYPPVASGRPTAANATMPFPLFEDAALVLRRGRLGTHKSRRCLSDNSHIRIPVGRRGAPAHGRAIGRKSS
jgi:hypothetical protein